MVPEIKIKALMKKFMKGNITAPEQAMLGQLWDLYDVDELAQLMDEAGAGLTLSRPGPFSQAEVAAIVHHIVEQCKTKAVAEDRKQRTWQLRRLKGIVTYIVLLAALGMPQFIKDSQYHISSEQICLLSRYK